MLRTTHIDTPTCLALATQILRASYGHSTGLMRQHFFSGINLNIGAHKCKPVQDPLDSKVERLPIHRARASHICFREMRKADELRVEDFSKENKVLNTELIQSDYNSRYCNR